MERYGRAGEEGSRSDPSLEWTTALQTGVQASVWRGGGESYPERPDEPDCIYYLRTGACGYGSRCRFNHPRDRGAVVGGVRGGGGGGDGALPERMGQPHFMRTGTCKFGATCKYHHPRQGGGSVAPVSLSYLGYPLRPGEKECSYYLRTGQCKFGLTCRFNHPVPQQQQQQPQPQPQLHTIYPTLQSQPSQQYGLVLARPSLLPGSYLPSHYGPPMVLPPGMVTYPGWNPYQASLTAMPSPGTQPSIGPSSVYGMAPLSPSGAAYTGTYQSGGPSSLTISKEEPFPQRPDQPECQYFMRTGDCKFGSSCRYHHPLDAVQPKTGVVLFSSIGLPLRPGVAQCTHFAQHGICKFGPACKFDHSMSSSLSYSPSASSLTDMPVAPYPIGSSSLSGASAPVSLSNEPTTEAVTAVSSPMVSGQEPAETSGDSASVSGSIEAKTSSSS
ncbi:hypothetical protein DY000_02051313 [Brassica cretica]|uniref:C3H1-type domain-containing protein n=1 Tax=Brassica cretica TaxID=69181 RepID=A0ABQ7F4S3_BRACR|nr:hypothetical protein DY000_02051313 [Brassica cretica]